MIVSARKDPLAYLGEQLNEWKNAGTFQRLRILESACAPESRFDGKDVINLASNNYLGLTTHPKLIEAALEATRKYGAGSGAVRTISGTMELHMELERRIAEFKGVEACVVFQSGFAANSGTVAAVLTPEDHVISDELNHASIIDGCRLSKARIRVFPHKDYTAAGRILESLHHEPGRKLLISDGVFSMDGDIGPLPGLIEQAERYGAIMMVDDAHASGVLGRNGRGTVDHFHVHGRVDIQVGTLSKAIGVLGGYVCGSEELIEFLYHRARPFLFSTSHPPAVTAACLAAFDVLEAEPERIDRLWSNTRHFKKGLAEAGFDTGISETPITPVIVGDAAKAHQLSAELFKEGVLATGISVALGVVFGLAAGYIGGIVDSLIARMIDVMLSVPFLLIGISIAYIVGASEWLVIVIVGVLSFTALGRIVRGQVISLKQKEYIEAARALGAGPWRIMFVDLLPNVMAQVIVYASLLIPLAIVTEAAFSFLGVGVPPPTADWGAMISDAAGYYQYGYWWYLFFPSLALLITTLAFNIFGDSVRDALDPRGGGLYV